MNIEINQVKHIAGLAKLNMADDEIDSIKNDLDSILTYIEKLNEINTEGVEPLSHPNELFNVLRDDVIKPSVTKEDALKNAPHKDNDFFITPKVI